MPKRNTNSPLKQNRNSTNGQGRTLERSTAGQPDEGEIDTLERYPETAESDDKLADLLSRIDRLAGLAVNDEVNEVAVNEVAVNEVAVNEVADGPDGADGPDLGATVDDEAAADELDELDDAYDEYADDDEYADEEDGDEAYEDDQEEKWDFKARARLDDLRFSDDEAGADDVGEADDEEIDGVLDDAGSAGRVTLKEAGNSSDELNDGELGDDDVDEIGEGIDDETDEVDSVDAEVDDALPVRLASPDAKREAARSSTEDAGRPAAKAVKREVEDVPEFFPPEPGSLAEAGLTESEVEQLILKSLLGRGESSGRELAEQLKLPFVLIDELLRRMKYDQLLLYRDSAPMNDYIYQMTDVGRERGRRFSESCSYYGAAPVAMDDYIQSVKAQSLETQHPTVEELRNAFSDLLINDRMLERLGPAINSGRGLFLFGAPGNGKTSIAERVTSAFGKTIWIPRAIGVDGEVMRLFDPVNHEEVPQEDSTGLLNQNRVDRRWIRIKRPTIVVGGELTMDALEVTMNRSTGISESPIQMKSNCGTLVIDDFGRQRMTTDELLNRWIVPLEKRYDFLNLANGKKLQVPFDQLIIFSTNLEPRDLVDEAFLRRIPYKIEVVDPSEEDFRGLFKIMCPKLGFEYNDDSVDHLIAEHYTKVGRPFRNCQPRDLLLQVRNHCFYQNLELSLEARYFDLAAENYFAVV